MPVEEREIDINPELPVDAKPETKIAEEPAPKTEQEVVSETERLDDNSAELSVEKMQKDYDALKAEYQAMIEKMKNEDMEQKTEMDQKAKMKEMSEEERMMEEKALMEEKGMGKEERMMEEKERMMQYMKEMMQEMMKEMMKEMGKHLPEEKKSSLQNEQNTAQKLDNSVNLNNSNSDINYSKGEDMSPEDIAKIVTQVTRSILAEQKVEPTVEKTEDRSKLDAAYGAKEPTKEELMARLEQAESTLNRVLEMPLRRGRHTSTSVRGIGSETEMENMISETQKEGHQSLASVVKRYKEPLMRSADRTATNKLSSHDLKDILAKGLRAAYLDGLLGTPVDGWQ